MKRRQLGLLGEEVARRLLLSKGYTICELNWRTRQGEVDLVAQDGETTVFVEVKTRASDRFGTPEAAVGAAKRRRLLRAAWAYLEAHDRLESDWRFDVVAIDCSPSGTPQRVEHYIDALEGEAFPEP